MDGRLSFSPAYQNLLYEITTPGILGTAQVSEALPSKITKLQHCFLHLDESQRQECSEKLQGYYRSLTSITSGWVYSKWHHAAWQETCLKLQQALKTLTLFPSKIVADFYTLCQLPIDTSLFEKSLEEDIFTKHLTVSTEILLKAKTPILTKLDEGRATVQLAVPSAQGMKIVSHTFTYQTTATALLASLDKLHKPSKDLLALWQEQAATLFDYLQNNGDLLHTDMNTPILAPYAIKVAYIQSQNKPLPLVQIYWHDGKEVHSRAVPSLDCVETIQCITALQASLLARRCYTQKFIGTQIPYSNKTFASALDYRLCSVPEPISLRLYYPDQHTGYPAYFSLEVPENASVIAFQQQVTTALKTLETQAQKCIHEVKVKFKNILVANAGYAENNLRQPKFADLISIELGSVNTKGHSLHYLDPFNAKIRTKAIFRDPNLRCEVSATLSAASVEAAFTTIQRRKALYQALDSLPVAKVDPDTKVTASCFSSITPFLIQGAPSGCRCRLYCLDVTTSQNLIWIDIEAHTDNVAQLQFEVQRALENLQQKQQEQLHWGVNVDNFLKKTSVLSTNEVPPLLPDIDLWEIEKYFDQINFSDPKSADYFSPHMIYNRLPVTKLKKHLHSFLEHIESGKQAQGLPEDPKELAKYYASLKAIVSQVIDIMHKEDDRRKVLKTALEMAIATSYCATRWITVVMHEYNQLHGLYHGASCDEYPFAEVALAWGDQLKEGVVHEMATELLHYDDPALGLRVGETHPHNSHVKRLYCEELHKKGYHIPLAAATAFSDTHTNIGWQGNYRTDKTIEEGYLSYHQASLLIDHYDSFFTNVLKEQRQQAIWPMQDLLLAYAEKYLLVQTTYKDAQEQMQRAFEAKAKALEACGATKQAEIKQIHTVLGEDERARTYLVNQWLRHHLQDHSLAKEPWKGNEYIHNLCLVRQEQIEEADRKHRNAIYSAFQQQRYAILSQVLEQSQIVTYNDEGGISQLTRDGKKALLLEIGFLIKKTLSPS